MDERVFVALGEAFETIPRLPDGGISDDAEASRLITWANSVLELAYAAGEFELDFDTTELKTVALGLRYDSELYLRHKKVSDIVGSYKALISHLRSACKQMAPALEEYLDFRVAVTQLR